ncbi:MAG: hypothetical protein ACRC1T_09815 [Clostridium chrysemydis]|uniref:hypothetical protein n=1 Tax=Clostridium chrysemydis TaxID=2665504 RepID=UPI003F398DAA
MIKINPRDEIFETKEGFDLIVNNIANNYGFEITLDKNNTVFVYTNIEVKKNFLKRLFSNKVEYKKELIYSRKFNLPEDYYLLNLVLLDIIMVF